jgi:uronate dehydrogenase
MARLLRLFDRGPITDLKPNEEAVICDFADASTLIAVCKGVDAIVPFGGTYR